MLKKYQYVTVCLSGVDGTPSLQWTPTLRQQQQRHWVIWGWGESQELH